MTKAIRWRIIVLQVIAILVLGFGSVAGFYASSFTSSQIRSQLAPQQIFFPKDAQSGLPADLKSYAGQQVLNGDQAHAYAEKFIGLHLQEIGQGHPYSYWSGLAMAEINPALKAKDQGIADTLFKGDTLQTMLNDAWTFSVIGQIAQYVAIGAVLATLAVIGALGFEVVEAARGKETVQAVLAPMPTTGPRGAEKLEPSLAN
ncbi:MAG TPA: hypothetical protein VJN88_03865 [Ktedonobacterales bacterium]|nr:hypothetical protein [Ktedonobacterales bacterium]